MQIYEVTKNVLVAASSDRERNEINDAPQTTTMTCIALPEELIFVDCGIYSKTAQKFRFDMEERFQRKTSRLLLSHTHWDHILAMKIFKDVDIVIAKKGISSLKRNYKGYLSPEERAKRADDYRKEDPELAADIKNAELFIPNISIKDELRIGPEEQEIIFKVVGIHTSDSAYVYSTSEQTLCTGDNLIECYPQLLGGSWKTLELLRSWEEMNIKHVIPGHGKPVDKDYVRNVRLYYEELIAFLKEQIRFNATLTNILKNPNLPKYFGVERPGWKYSCRPGANWLANDIKSWYNFLKKDTAKDK